ncbi:DUF2637 domain-containing protein [Streptosporangium sp. NPDC020072]|uniref:DUF2637 domain-containing protein n=1 Tax=Streptosporangium sp. NPDC020072 TaxID=3154788 RepID=UPI00343C0791
MTFAETRRVLSEADPNDKAEVHAQTGLRLTYQPQKKLVEARVQPGLHMCERYVSEGGVVPNAHVFTLTTRFLLGQGRAAMVPDSLTVRRIQRTTIACVALLAVIAAVVSFRHMHELCLRHGEDRLAAVLIPLAVDGIIVVASMSILLANRYGSRGGAFAWTLLVVGSLAGLGVNIAVAEPGLTGRVIAAWPSVALIGSYELLMSQIRRVSWNTGRQPSEPQQEPEDEHPREGVVVLHREARENGWPDGTLPSERAIAERFEHSPRWIKRAGLTGKLG